jgi:iron-sulfur cluster repair protein YtfE (RIC family)
VGDQAMKEQIAEQVFVELETHTQIEELVFYPAFAETADDEGQQMIEEARQEHQTVKDLIADMRAMDDTDEFPPNSAS